MHVMTAAVINNAIANLILDAFYRLIKINAPPAQMIFNGTGVTRRANLQSKGLGLSRIWQPCPWWPFPEVTKPSGHSG